MNNDAILDRLIKREGGLVDNPHDWGGLTKYGITMRTLSRWLGRAATVEDMRNLTKPTARKIYQAFYVEKPGFDKIRDDELREVMIDCGVLHGPRQPICWLQKCLHVRTDGIIGPLTRASVNAHSFPSELLIGVTALRIRFIGRLITRRPSQAMFAGGWLNRATGFLL